MSVQPVVSLLGDLVSQGLVLFEGTEASRVRVPLRPARRAPRRSFPRATFSRFQSSRNSLSRRASWLHDQVTRPTRLEVGGTPATDPRLT